MSVENLNSADVLERLALQYAADAAVPCNQHTSRICHISAATWQADILKKSGDVRQVDVPDDLRSAMSKADLNVIYIPQTAMIVSDTLNRVCAESAFDKLIILEVA